MPGNKNLNPDQQLVSDFHSVFGTISGERVLSRLSDVCSENRPTYVDSNAQGTAYNEGRRSVILHIRRMMNRKIKEDEQEKAITERDD